MIDLLSFHYSNLFHAMSHAGKKTPQCAVVTMDELRRDLCSAVKGLYRQLSLTESEQFNAALLDEQQRNSGYRSRHQYSAERFGLDELDLKARFAHVYAQPIFRGGEDTSAERDFRKHKAVGEA
jgi:hypothetical protein